MYFRTLFWISYNSINQYNNLLESMKEKITKTARSWIGTPFKHQGRIKGLGVDCVGLIVCIAAELNLTTQNGSAIASYDVSDYDIISDGYALENFLDENLIRLESLEVGALVLMSFDSNPQHLGVVSDYLEGSFGLIHADLKAGEVVEHHLDAHYASKIKKIYKLGE